MAPQRDDLIIDRSAAPAPLEEQLFREWLSRHRFFISSVMDEEMTPFRQAVRDRVRGLGGTPVMWEEIVPRDERSNVAYLDGVTRSDGFILLLGNRYGVSDETGYSPTHKEANHAKTRGIPRLLFDLGGPNTRDRDGRVVDWSKSLYAEVSAAKFADQGDLVQQLEQRLREMGSQQESPWVKLGPIVAPGTVDRRSTGGETVFAVRIRTRDPQIQRALSSLATHYAEVHVDRLTWDATTYPIVVENAESATVSTSVQEYTITCRHALGRGDSPMNVTSNDVTPAEQALIWSRRTLFGQDRVDSSHRAFDYRTAPEFEPLPELLQRYGARGWFAEGLTRLYFVEGITSKFEGEIVSLEVGPATSSAVRIEAKFHITTHERETITIEGLAPLR